MNNETKPPSGMSDFVHRGPTTEIAREINKLKKRLDELSIEPPSATYGGDILIAENCPGGGIGGQGYDIYYGLFMTQTQSIFNINITKVQGEDRFVIVFFHKSGAIVDCTLNGVSGHNIPASNAQMGVYYFLDEDLPAAAGSYQIVCTWATANQQRAAGAMEFWGVNQVSPIGTLAESTTNALTVSSVLNNLVVDFIENDPIEVITPDVSQTLQMEYDSGWVALMLAMSTTTATSSSTSLDWDASGPIRHAGIAINISPTSAMVLRELIVPCNSIVSASNGVVEIDYGAGALADHDHSGDAGDGGQFDAANLESGAADDGQVLTADGVGGAAWEDPPLGAGLSLVTTVGDPGSDVNIPTEQAVREAISAIPGLQINQAGGTGDTYGALAGTRNGINTQFTVSEGFYPTGTLLVFLNGQLLTQGSAEGWVETDPAAGTFDFAVAPEATDEITTVHGGAGGGGGGKPHQSEIIFIKHSLNYTYGSGVTTTYIWPGDALTASTQPFYADKLTGASIIYARWVNVWTPNAPGGTPTGIRLVHADSGPANITEIAKFEVDTYLTPRVDAVEVTTDLQTLLNNGVWKQLGIQVRGDGSNYAKIYASWIEIVWEG